MLRPVALAIALALAAPFAPPVQAAGDAHVHIQGFAFDPSTVTISEGQGITWDNHDGASHTATDTGGRWDTGVLGPGEAATLVFDTPGTFEYLCSIHPSMEGTVVVEAVPDEPPTVAITAPPDGALVEGLVLVEGVAADLEGSLDLVELRIDGGAWQAASGLGVWTFPWDTTAGPNGDHVLEARSFDGTHHSAVDAVTVTVANGGPGLPPVVAITSPLSGALVEGLVTVRGVASDPDSAVERVEVRIDGGPWQAGSGTTDWSLAWDTTAVPDGPHAVEARATDGVLVSPTARVDVEVDNLKPDLRVDWVNLGLGATDLVVTARLVNEGDDITGPFTIGFLYRDGEGVVRSFGNYSYPGIEPDGSGGGRIARSTLGFVGAFDIIVVADARGEVRELDETNNYKVEVACLPLALPGTCDLPGVCRYEAAFVTLDRCTRY